MEALGVIKDVFEESFPALTPGTRARFKSFLTTHSTDYKWLYSPSLKECLTQGDIFIEMPAFYFQYGDVVKSKISFPSILLEHTCDMSIDEGECRNPNYVAAPLFPLESFEKIASVDGLKLNQISHKLYVGTVPELNKEYFVDLNLMCNVSAEWLHYALRGGEIKRICSLTDTGYFFLLAKLTTHLLRADR